MLNAPFISSKSKSYFSSLKVFCYPCTECDYVATKASNLKQHKKSKHEGIRFSLYWMWLPCNNAKPFKAAQEKFLAFLICFWLTRLILAVLFVCFFQIEPFLFVNSKFKVTYCRVIFFSQFFIRFQQCPAWEDCCRGLYFGFWGWNSLITGKISNKIRVFVMLSTYFITIMSVMSCKWLASF